MRFTRRAVLAATGAGAVGVAGCLGGDGGADGGAASTSYDCDAEEREPVSELPAPALGDDDAEVSVTVFEDFACPHCATFATEEFPDLAADYADEGVARFERRDFLVVDSDWNEPVANAARSVQDAEGSESFFDYAHRMYERQSDYSWEVIGEQAEAVGAEPCRVLADAEHETYRSVVEADQSRAQERDVPGTPTILVEGRTVSEPTYDAVSAAIEDAR